MSVRDVGIATATIVTPNAGHQGRAETMLAKHDTAVPRVPCMALLGGSRSTDFPDFIQRKLSFSISWSHQCGH
jgi:hypothetical protein